MVPYNNLGEWPSYEELKDRIAELEAQLAAMTDERNELQRERQEQIDIIMSNPVTCINGITHPAKETQYDDCLYCYVNGLRQQLAAAQERTMAIRIIFDGPPGPDAGQFVEVETDTGESISIGEWIDRKDGYWALRIAKLPAPPEQEDTDDH